MGAGDGEVMLGMRMRTKARKVRGPPTALLVAPSCPDVSALTCSEQGSPTLREEPPLFHAQAFLHCSLGLPAPPWPWPSTNLLGRGRRIGLLPRVAGAGLVRVPGQLGSAIGHLQGAVTLAGHCLQIVPDLLPEGEAGAGAVSARACNAPLQEFSAPLEPPTDASGLWLPVGPGLGAMLSPPGPQTWAGKAQSPHARMSMSAKAQQARR